MKSTPGKTIGILGGGQLARMLAMACHEMGHIPVVLSEKSDDPAAQVVSRWRQGSAQDRNALEHLLMECDHVTFESEFVDLPTSEKVLAQSERFFPAPEVMQKLQDRRSQKKLLLEFKIPTATFKIVDTPDQLNPAVAALGFPCVLKKARGGYDGYGTFILKNAKSVSDFLATEWVGPCILEKWIPFQREIAVLFSRSRNGSFIEFPLVESRQTNNRCDWVVGPTKSKHLKALSAKFKKMMAAQKYVGILAVELFETSQEIFVNELAPRVHNSGHYSMDALSVSQFHSHICAGLGQKLVTPELRSPAFVMTNLIGESTNEFLFPDSFSGRLHWYGKKDNRKGRKMGHVNYTGKNTKSLLKIALKERKAFSK